MNTAKAEKNLLATAKGSTYVELNKHGSDLAEKIKIMFVNLSEYQEDYYGNLFTEIIDMSFELLKHHRYGVLYNVLKKFYSKS